MFHYACIPTEKFSANYWLILYFLITDPLPVPALWSVDVICYILLYLLGTHLTASTISLFPPPNPVHSIPNARISSESGAFLISSVPFSVSALPYAILYSGKYILNQRSILFWLLVNSACNRNLMFCSVLRSA